MKIIEIDQNSEEWLEARKGKITGSKLKDIIAKKNGDRKVGFYKLIAERLAIEPDEEDVMERGHRLEDEAIARYESETGNKVEKVGLCVRDDCEGIALSPDGLILIDGIYKEAIEIKCLASHLHLQAIIENKVPSEYYYQMLQYFIVIDELEKLTFLFYDPRIACKEYHTITKYRSEFEEQIQKERMNQMVVLEQVKELVEKLSF